MSCTITVYVTDEQVGASYVVRNSTTATVDGAASTPFNRPPPAIRLRQPDSSPCGGVAVGLGDGQLRLALPPMTTCPPQPTRGSSARADVAPRATATTTAEAAS